MFNNSTTAGCNMKYQILRYFNMSCSLGRNEWVEWGGGLKFCY